jgi:hypothetical protein
MLLNLWHELRGRETRVTREVAERAGGRGGQLRTPPPAATSQLGHRVVLGAARIQQPFGRGCCVARSKNLVKSFQDHHLACFGGHPDRNRRTVDPTELDLVGCLSLDRQQACMKCTVVATAQQAKIP